MTEFEEAMLAELRAIRELLETIPDRMLDEQGRRAGEALREHMQANDALRASLKPPGR